MFSNDCDFDIDEDFLKDVFQSVEEHAEPKRSLPPPQENVTKKLRVGSSVPPTTSAEVHHGTTPPLLPVETPSSSVKKRRTSEGISRQRKFPGPAGLLPDRGGSLNRTLEAQSDSEDDSDMPSQALCSQPSGAVFQSEAWLQAERDLGLVGPAGAVLATCTLRWARGKALAGQLPNLRVPFLLVALHTIDCTLQDPFVLFHDPTGQMPGTLHREVREVHETRLRPGTVLVLRQVGVLTTRRTLRNYYLNVTANNLVSIYHVPDQLRPNHVEVVRLRDVSLLEAAQSISDIQERRLVIDLPAAHLLDDRDEPLFSCVGSPSVIQRSISTPFPGVQPRNVSPQVLSRFSGNRQTVSRPLANVQSRSLTEISSPVSTFPRGSSIRPRHVPVCDGVSQVSSRLSSSGSKPTVVPTPNALNFSCSNGQNRSLVHTQSNLITRQEPVPNKVVCAQGFGFKPKTSQLGNLGAPHLANGWNGGGVAGDTAPSSNVQGHVKNTQCSSNSMDSDDERRIVENVLESFDPSQLFDEDF